MRRLMLFALVMVALPGGVSRAQPIFTKVQSLEWMAADCPTIVRGTVVDFVREVRDLHGAGDRGMVWDTLVLKVRETIKGRHRPYHTFVLLNFAYREKLPLWKVAGRELLVFLDDSPHVEVGADGDRDGRPLAYEMTPRFEASGLHAIFAPTEAGDPRSFVGERASYTMDLHTLKDYGAILRHVRADVGTVRAAGVLRSHEVRWPKGAENVDRMVPVDGRLEALAREWARSDQPALREEGAKALGYFKSDDVVAILKGLLADPSFEIRFEYRGLEAIQDGREFRVRQAALASLRGLGVGVAEPILYERLPRGKADTRP